MSSAIAVATKTVVVADDTAFVRDRFKSALEAAGHHTVTVTSGNELVRLVRSRGSEIGLVVVDLRLPQANGVELVRRLRRIDGATPPIVVFSGTIANPAEVRELAALDVSGYVNEYTTPQHILPALAPHLFPEHVNRRSGPRVVLGIPVAYRFGNTIAGAVTLNISQGGVAVRTTSPLEKGRLVRARFRLPLGKRDIDVESRVVWSDTRAGMGLEVVNLARADAEAITEYVNSHFFSNRKA
jgi:CheY-like chemotaxis protein